MTIETNRPNLRTATLALPQRGVTLKMVQDYLPSNYSAYPYTKETIRIKGYDRFGWTLDEYVIPRLRSGLMVATEDTYPGFFIWMVHERNHPSHEEKFKAFKALYPMNGGDLVTSTHAKLAASTFLFATHDEETLRELVDERVKDLGLDRDRDVLGTTSFFREGLRQ